MYEGFKKRVLLKTKYNQYFGENVKVWEANDFIADLTLHIPCNNLHLIRYYGLYSSRSRGKWKDLPHILRLSPLGWLKKQEDLSIEYEEQQDLPEPVHNKCSRKAWARLIAKVYKVDPLVCPQCKAEMKVVAVIIDPIEVRKILLHLKELGRAPPGVDWDKLESA